MKKKIILASRSPRRREILKEMGIGFEIHYPEIDELQQYIGDPYRFCEEMAIKKAKSIMSDVPAGIILGADTIVLLDGEIIGKPQNHEDAKRILGRLCGTTHEVVTAICLICIDNGKELISHSKSKVTMKRLAKDEIVEYTEKHLDKAGAYGIQDKDDPIARVVEGSYSNVVGLDKELLKKMLKEIQKE